MTFDIPFGYWLIPTLVTVYIFLRAGFRINKLGGGYGAEVVGGYYVLIACNISLVAWLIWALLR